MSTWHDVATGLRYMGRALLLRCPNCGAGGILAGYFKLRDRCPRCGLHLEREEPGYVVGAATFNIIVAELVFMGLFVGLLLWTWPDPPWTFLQVGGLTLMVLLPILFYPFSKTTFLAFDLVFRPRGEGDRERPDEGRPA